MKEVTVSELGAKGSSSSLGTGRFGGWYEAGTGGAGTVATCVGAGVPALSALHGTARTALGEHSARRGQLQLAARLLRGKITSHFPGGGCEETT